jgi:hypothetical protein
VQLEIPEIVLDGVPGVIPALKPDDKIGVFSEIIDHPAFALISPVDPDKNP